MIQKYFKPTSLTWLTGFVPLTCGLVVATEPLHGQAALVMSIENGTQLSAPELLMSGFGLIGIRGAIG